MISRHDRDIYFPMSFSEQMSCLGGKIERIIKEKKESEVRDSYKNGFSSYALTINKFFHIIKEDPKNVAVLREVKRAEREWWAYVYGKSDTLSGDKIFTYWHNYLRAYYAELEAQPVSYFLIRGYDEFHDGDEWIGIYDSIPELEHAYKEAVQKLEKEHINSDSRAVANKKVMINAFNKATGKWCYDIPYEMLFPEKAESKCEEYKTVCYVMDHPEMIMFKQQCIQRGRYGDYIYDSQILKLDRHYRTTDEAIPVKFKVKNTYEIFEKMGVWWGGWNECPDWRTMRDKAQEWHTKYGAELKEISHDTVVFVCRELSKEEVDVLWNDICQFAPNSANITSNNAFKEGLSLNPFTLWWD